MSLASATTDIDESKEKRAVKINRYGQLASVALVGTLALAACGSNSNAGSTSSASGSASGSGSISCASGKLKASGSTAQANAMTDWINAYQTACSGATIEYQGVGSGAGVTDFINKQTDFAGSDSSLKVDSEQPKADARCSAGPAINIPMVGGAIALTYNLQGVTKLALTSQTIAGIFAGKITKWNDPAIAAANAGVSLPSSAILSFHRSDASGTTDNFTKFLKAAAPAVWTYQGGKSWTAPGGQGAKGNDGVSTGVKSTPNSIGYVELSYALNNNLPVAAVDNGAGPVDPTSETASKALASAKVTGTGNNLPLKINYNIKDASAYPIVLVTYEITCEKGLDSAQAALVKSFLTFTASDAGQSKLSTTGYVPMSGDLLTKVRASVEAIS